MTIKSIQNEMTKTEEEYMAHAKQEAEKAVAQAREKFHQAEKEIKHSIEQNPVRAAVIAAGLGAAIGAAVTFALMKKKKEG